MCPHKAEPQREFKHVCTFGKSNMKLKWGEFKHNEQQGFEVM